ncbi:glycine oxidase [Pseudosulfitobacter pseudonitzschiae]|uniref:D-amino-acid oxidase n=1 Tax=Pseudosulfitobacter pseudonitzschiae TaxID=1402135 RepID=A0A073IY64_9RHOB|nr:FAD-dependent oxidoreductase [Pseudosulfitobacter pseudonitzschiae]KEJ94520.1 thiamine biosynthesis protein thio [Pseudosulfitobacter pseudonitzschiae]QKS10937.1 FAD-dependent oxidoreductase [Pseudosulfitobacter pseudonitzschiae]SHG10404.1 glycine oxidase [Pseudosulfitobacter pseudonitzschiae]
MSGPFTILGGGVCGLAMAAELSSRGARVTVIDPKGAPGGHACSWWAGGMLAPDCEGVSAEPEIVRQGRKAAGWWESQGAAVHHAGTLVVALNRDQSDLATFARRAPRAATLPKTQIAEQEPHLAERYSKALFLADEGHLDPRATLTALHARLAQRGVRFGGDIAGQVIDCRGLVARDTLTDLRGVKGEMLVVRCTDVTLSRPVRLLHPRFPLYIVPRGDGVFMLGATQIETGERSRATLRSVMELMNAAYALHPAFGEAELLEIGVDARPAFPDNQPRIRRIGDVIYANGLFRHGFLLAPALAQMTVDLVLEGKIPEVWYEDYRER